MVGFIPQLSAKGQEFCEKAMLAPVFGR
jgi:hypothetical protein